MDTQAERKRVGLCFACQHARRLVNRRGNAFYQCRMADQNKAFLDYPPLPVQACSGFADSEGPSHQRDDSSLHEEDPL